MTLKLAKEAYKRKDFTAANDIWSALAEEGVAEAMFWLGELNYHGRGIPKNASMALELYARAAERGFTKAYYSMGFCHLTGEGTRADYVEAVKWLRLAIDNGSHIGPAEYFVGRCHARGQGVPRDHQQAVVHYTRAAHAGDEDAAFLLASVYERGYILPEDRTEARKWYSFAAEHGHEQAQRWMESEHNRAIVYASRAIGADPVNLQAFRDRCHAYIGVGKYDRALEDCDRLTGIDAKSTWPHITKAVIYDKKKDWAGVIASASKAIELDPSCANAFHWRGWAHEKRGDNANALVDFRKVLELSPENESISRTVAKLEQLGVRTRITVRER